MTLIDILFIQSSPKQFTLRSLHDSLSQWDEEELEEKEEQAGSPKGPGRDGGAKEPSIICVNDTWNSTLEPSAKTLDKAPHKINTSQQCLTSKNNSSAFYD